MRLKESPLCEKETTVSNRNLIDHISLALKVAEISPLQNQNIIISIVCINKIHQTTDLVNHIPTFKIKISCLQFNSMSYYLVRCSSEYC